MFQITKGWEFIKEAQSPGPHSDRHGVRGQSKGHLGSVGQIFPAQVWGLRTLIEEERSGSGHEPRWEGIVVEFLKYRTFSSRWAKFRFFKRGADNAIRIADRVTIHGTLADITVILGMVCHHMFKANDSIEVAYNQVIILAVFERIIPGVASTPLESLFDLTLKDTSLSRIFPKYKLLDQT